MVDETGEVIDIENGRDCGAVTVGVVGQLMLGGERLGGREAVDEAGKVIDVQGGRYRVAVAVGVAGQEHKAAGMTSELTDARDCASIVDAPRLAKHPAGGITRSCG
jgi:hypothetical protein